LSGAQKRKRQKQREQFIQSQKGVLHKFFSTSSSVVPADNVVDAPRDSKEGQ
jgi:hypothetical protein